MSQNTTPRTFRATVEQFSTAITTTIDNSKKSRKILRKLVYQLREIIGQSGPQSDTYKKLSGIEDELIKAMILISIAEQACEASDL